MEALKGDGESSFLDPSKGDPLMCRLTAPYMSEHVEQKGDSNGIWCKFEYQGHKGCFLDTSFGKELPQTA
jgi:hypothetical protein